MTPEHTAEWTPQGSTPRETYLNALREATLWPDTQRPEQQDATNYLLHTHDTLVAERDQLRAALELCRTEYAARAWTDPAGPTSTHAHHGGPMTPETTTTLGPCQFGYGDTCQGRQRPPYSATKGA